MAEEVKKKRSSNEQRVIKIIQSNKIPYPYHLIVKQKNIIKLKYIELIIILIN